MVWSFGENNTKDNDQFTPAYFTKKDIDKLLLCINKSYSITMSLVSGLTSRVVYMCR